MEPELITIIELFATAILALFAYIQNRQKNTIQAENAQVVAFFDPADDSVSTAPPKSQNKHGILPFLLK